MTSLEPDTGIELPDTEATPLLRTDFASDHAWQALLTAVRAESPEGFRANVEVVNDMRYGRLTNAQLQLDSSRHAVVFIADARSMRDPNFLLLCVDSGDAGRSFRVIASEAWSVENNLSLGNMDFDEFVAAAGEDGIFRGFST